MTLCSRIGCKDATLRTNLGLVWGKLCASCLIQPNPNKKEPTASSRCETEWTLKLCMNI